MTVADTSLKVAPDVTGGDVAFITALSKLHQGVMLLGKSGHIVGTAPSYVLYVPSGAVGASKVYFDLFNATGSGKTLNLRSVRAIKNGTVAVTGVLSVQLFLTRTTAIGTGGTAATSEGTSLTAATISKRDPGDAALPAGVTARLAPTGGATAGAVLAERHIFSEETNAAGYDHPEFVASAAEDVQPFVIPENTGVRIVQGAVASVGNISFELIFEAV